MDFAKGLLKAYETKWSYVNTFNVHIQFADAIKKEIQWTNADEENINLNIISIDTPQFTNQSIDVFIGDRWKTHNGRDELYRFSITFRDQDQMLFYKKFVKAYFYQQKNYFDKVKMSVILSKDPDYWDEENRQIFEFQDAMIESVSQVQFNNTTEAQIAEFTVQLKCTLPLLK